LRGKQKSQNVHVELLSKVLLVYAIKWAKFEKRRVIHKDIQPSISLLGTAKQFGSFGPIRNISLECNRIPFTILDCSDNLLRLLLAGSVVDGNSGTFRREGLGDGSPNPPGRSGHNCNFIF
jgi:hypothetical protein